MVLEIFVAGLLIALAVAAIVGLIRLIREVFSRGREVMQGEEDSSEDQVEKLEPREKKRKEKSEGSFWERMGKALTPEERIRRIYRKTLEKELAVRKEEDRAGLIKGATPRECCAALFSEKEQQALEFAGLYEKARYARGVCKGEDVKRARKLAEEFHS